MGGSPRQPDSASAGLPDADVTATFDVSRLVAGRRINSAIPPTTTLATPLGTLCDFQALISRFFSPSRALAQSLHDRLAAENDLNLAARVRLQIGARLPVEDDLRRVLGVVVRPAVRGVFGDDVLHVVRVGED